MSSESKRAWDQLAQTFATSRQVSADKLIEWPAQLRLSSPFVGKRVLDVGCGTGEKANHFLEHGAATVLAIDPSEGYHADWEKRQSANLTFLQGDFQNLHELVGRKTFDLIVCFQALMYADDLNIAVQTMSELLTTGGMLTVSVPHPFRFAILRKEIEGWPMGTAYQRTGSYRYPSPWKEDVYLQHIMPRMSDYLNAFARSGLTLERCEEPPATDDFRALAPEKAAWMDRYIGIVVFRLTKAGK